MTSKLVKRIVVLGLCIAMLAVWASVALAEGMSITQLPQDVAVANGKKATVTVVVEGDGLTYRWYYRNAGEGAFTYTSSFKGNSYSVQMNADRDGRQVYCVISDSNGNKMQTNTVTLSLVAGVEITTQPQDVVAVKNKSVSITLEAQGEGLKYVWYYANKGATSFKKSSVTTATYKTTMSSTSNGRRVYCVVTDQYGNKVQSETVTLTMATALKITTQPKDAANVKNKSVEITVKAQGDGLKYAWYYANKGSSTFKKSSVKTAAYKTTMTSTSNGRQVYCIVTDKYGNTVQSDTVTLTMATALKITKQPKDAANVKNESVEITVTAQGDGLKYAWYYANKGSSTFKKSSVTTATYTAKMTSTSNGRQVYCVVTDKYGNKVQSNTVTLTMATQLKITTQPKDAAAFADKSVKITVAAQGDGLKYAWYYANAGATTFKKSSVTSATYTAKLTSTSNGRRVYCIVTDKYGNKVQSDTVTMTMHPAPEITSQPADVIAGMGEKVSVSVDATGEGLKYQWYYRNSETGEFKKSTTAKTDTYTVTIGEKCNWRQVYCLVTDGGGKQVKSDVVTLQVAVDPIVLKTQPVDYEGDLNESVFCSVSALGTGLKYQWYYKNAGSSKFVAAEGFTTDTYEIVMTEKANGREVYCVITDVAGNTVQTRTVTLAIRSSGKVSGLQYRKDGDIIYITGYTGKETDLVIPAYITGAGWVAGIDNGAFAFNTTLRSIVLPYGLAWIEWDAFRNCTALESVTIPDSVTRISAYAFENCTSLTSIKLPPNITEGGLVVFEGCTNLKKIYVAFDSETYKILKADGLEHLLVPEGTYDLVANQDFSYTVSRYNDTYWYARIDRYSGNASELVIPATIDDYNVKMLASWVFADHTEITSLIIPNTVTDILNYTFKGCTGLTNVVLPSSVTEVSGAAFMECSNLKTIYLPSGLTCLGERAFAYCSSLTSITIPENITALEEGLLRNCTALKKVTFMGDVTSIAMSVFNGCSNLTEIDIPESVTYIGGSAFASCSSLKSVTLPKGITTIEYGTFSGCSALQKIDIPYGVTSIGEQAFMNCTSLTSVKIPGSVKTIGSNAFSSCTSLTSIVMEEGVTSIDAYAFAYNDNLISVTIPSSVNSMPNGLFLFCNNLTSIIVEEGSYAYNWCLNNGYEAKIVLAE